MVKDDLKIAFVQDAMLFLGGADKVVEAALEVFPHAPIYTLVYNPEAYRGTAFEGHPVHTSFLDRLPAAHRNHRLFLPLMPLALERLDLHRYDVVVAFSYAVAHAAPTRSRQLHISYLHTPMRYAWQPRLVSQISPQAGRLPYRMADRLLGLFRGWDARMAKRTDFFLTNSFCTADLIQKAYRRQAEVLYPPVDTGSFRPIHPRGDYYVAVSRLIRHKRLDLVVQAFTQLGYPLLVAGEGPEENRLRSLAGSNVQFLGWQPQERLVSLLGQAKAFVHAGEEDFGIAIAEAQAAGCPAITLERGASPEIVRDGQTGILFPEQTVASLVEAIRRFESQGVACTPDQIQAEAQRFSRDRFKDEFEALVMGRWVEFEQKRKAASRWQDAMSFPQKAVS